MYSIEFRSMQTSVDQGSNEDSSEVPKSDDHKTRVLRIWNQVKRNITDHTRRLIVEGADKETHNKNIIKL